MDNVGIVVDDLKAVTAFFVELVWSWRAKGQLSFGAGSGYVEAERLAEETADIASAAMLALAEAMRFVQDAWPAASDPLGGPKFRIR
jgi:hypothetical protein